MSISWYQKFSLINFNFKKTLAVSRTHVDRNEMPPRPAVVLTKNIWKQVILLDNHKIAETIRRPWPLISVAVAKGNFEFIKTLIDYYPDIIWEVDNNGHSIFHIAVSNRQKSIFDLIYSLGPVKDVIISSKDNNDNTILHLAGLLAPSNCLNVEAGEALQMQRELTWFKVSLLTYTILLSFSQLIICVMILNKYRM